MNSEGNRFLREFLILILILILNSNSFLPLISKITFTSSYLSSGKLTLVCIVWHLPLSSKHSRTRSIPHCLLPIKTILNSSATENKPPHAESQALLIDANLFRDFAKTFQPAALQRYTEFPTAIF